MSNFVFRCPSFCFVRCRHAAELVVLLHLLAGMSGTWETPRCKKTRKARYKLDKSPVITCTYTWHFEGITKNIPLRTDIFPNCAGYLTKNTYISGFDRSRFTRCIRPQTPSTKTKNERRYN
eukprot:g6381.t1